MLRSTRLARCAARFKSATGLTKPELQKNIYAQQAPNRATPWSKSQEARAEVVARHPYRFTQRELDKQPQPFSAMELIAQQPIRYLSHHDGNIAVCDGNKGSTLQGHPKVFINLDKPEPAACGYCGLRYAKEEHRETIEGKQHES